MEIWKNIEIQGFEGFYQVSNLGNVRSVDRVVIYRNGGSRKFEGQTLKQKIDKYGYATVCLKNCGFSKFPTVHRLVAQSFIENPDEKSTVNHKDGNKLNNDMSNLEWATCKENTIHAICAGLITPEFLKEKSDYFSALNLSRSKPVVQLKNGVFINNYGSATIAVQNLSVSSKSASCISECCLGKRKTAFGYEWKFA